MSARWAGVAAMISLAAAIPVAAHASSISGGSYLGAPGELNRIAIDRQDSAGTYTYTDLGVVAIDPPDPSVSACTVSGNQATCPRPPASLAYDVLGGDQADTITDAQGGYPFAIDGGTGNDEIRASGILSARGGPGNDHMIGGPGTETLLAGPYRNDLGSGFAPESTWLPDDDHVEGLAGLDFLFGDVGSDVVEGGDGNDEVDGGTGNDVLRGGPGNDTMDINRSQTCAGCPLAGGADSDIFEGGGGDDRLIGAYDQGAPDSFSCGPGTDVAEIGAHDQVASDCEEVQQLVSCPSQGGPCSFVVEVSAKRGPTKAAKEARKRHRHRGKRVVLGTRLAKLSPGRSKSVTVRLNSRRLRAALRGDGRARGLLDTKLAKKKGKTKRVSRTRFTISR